MRLADKIIITSRIIGFIMIAVGIVGLLLLWIWR